MRRRSQREGRLKVWSRDEVGIADPGFDGNEKIYRSKFKRAKKGE